MVRISHIPTGLANSGALPSGGKTDDTARLVGKVIDKSISQLDRHRRHIPRKTQESSKIFVPLDPNEAKPKTARGTTLHTDPFAENREHVEYRRAKVKVATPRGPNRGERRLIKPVAAVEHAVNPHEFIASNGVRHTSPKRVPKAKHATTIGLAQSPKNFFGNKRFAMSPGKQGVAPPAALTAIQSPSELSPATPHSVASAPRVISNVFPSENGFSAIQAPPHHGVRVNPKKVNYVTMEGVFSPMRNGRVPKPVAIAPWAQETMVAHSGRRYIADRSQVTSAPFAIEA